jgi:flagellar protein FlaG
MSSINANSASGFNYTFATDKVAKVVGAEPGLTNDTQPGTFATAGKQQISKAELQQAIDVVNQAVALDQRSLSFSIDDVSGRSVIKVVDFETDELIKQIPSEELLKVAQDIKRLQEEMGQSIGLLIDKTV